jgi:GNAT superfamily N-acetyltransferase
MMEFKKLDLAGLEAMTDILGEAQHAFFDPSQPDHHAWARDMAARHLGRGTRFWAGLVAGEPVGLVGLLHDNQPNGKGRGSAEIALIGVRKDVRGKGYGSFLLVHAESVALSQGAQILELRTNMSTTPFYEKNGYVIDATHRFLQVVDMCKDLRTARGTG